MILADRDLSTGWVSGADAAEKRYYYLQNWRADTCALVNDAGMVVRSFRYSAYGSRTDIGGTDFNRDGVSDFFDYLDFVDLQDIDSDDLTGASTRNLCAGYENDPRLEAAAQNPQSLKRPRPT